MPGSVTEEFNNLRLPDGEPDIHERRTQLNAIIRGLSTWEIRLLREQLNSIPTPTINDISGRLPTEIFIQIAGNLDLEDVMHARCVCRAWNSKFGSNDVSMKVMELYFFREWKTRYASLDDAAKDDAKGSLSLWLTGAAMERNRRLHGQYHSMELYWYKQTLNVPFLSNPYQPSSPAEPQYSTGRIAFRLDSRTIVVRSLRGKVSASEVAETEASATFMDDQREPLDKFLLSDEFLIAQKSRPLILLAWPLSTTQNARGPQGANHTQSINGPYTCRLSAHFNTWFASHDKVGLINSEIQIMIWKIGGACRLIDISGIRNDFAGFYPLAIVFHPVSQDRFFLASHGTLEINTECVTLRVAMHEFVKDALIRGHHKDLTFDDPTGMLSYFKMVDSWTGFFYGVPLSKLTSETANHATFCNHIDKDRLELLGYTFDIYIGEFSPRTYHLPDVPASETITIRSSNGVDQDQVFFRRDQALVPVYHMPVHLEDGSSVPVSDILLMAINNCDSTRKSDQRKRIPWYNQLGCEDTTWFDQSKVPDRTPCFFSPSAEDRYCRVSYCWFQGSLARLTGREYISNDDIRGSIRGDDDFVVLFGDYGYYVWCFDKRIKLPKEGSRCDPNLPDAMQLLKLPYPLKKQDR